MGEKGEGRVNRMTLAESNGGLLVKHVTIRLTFLSPDISLLVQISSSYQTNLQ